MRQPTGRREGDTKKSGSLLRLSPQIKYDFMREHCKGFSIKAMCRLLGVSPSGYYRWCSRPNSKRAQEDDRLLCKIQTLYSDSRSNYGSPKIYRRLRQQAEECNHKRVERLMRQNGIRAKRVKKFKVTTDSRHSEPVADNILARGLKVSGPDKVWVSEITYVWSDEGWLYLAVFVDLFSMLVVGWSMSERVTSEKLS